MKSFLLITVVAALQLQAGAFLRDTAFNIVSTLAERISPKTDASSSACECGGVNNVNTRVLNGVKTTLEGPFSSFVQIVNATDKRISCSGFIVTPLHVVTAAHCVEPFTADKITVVAGNPYNEYRTGKTTQFTQKVGVAQKQPAAYTGEGNRENDIAVLVLDEPLDFNRMVSRACLPKESQDLGGQTARIAGWGGVTQNQANLEDQITEGIVTIMNAKSCHKYWQLIPAVNPKQICVVSKRNKQQRATDGDSGSPVLWYDESIQRYVAVGLISYGLADVSINYPRVNTKVAEYLKFINSVVESTSSEKTCSRS